MIFFLQKIVHRTVAAIFTTFTSIGVLAALHDRPTMSDVVTWVDCESLLLILSMMVLVAFLSDTGFFEQISLYALQVNYDTISYARHSKSILTKNAHFTFCQLFVTFR